MVLQTEFAQIKGKNLFLDDVKATDLVKQYGTPLYVMSEGHIRKQFNTLKTKMIDKYENTLPLFASKSFSCKAIYKLAMEYGVGIDCVSAGEISVALKAGFDPKKVYFHGNNKLPSEIQYALENGVENFVIDNFYEIELVEEIMEGDGSQCTAFTTYIYMLFCFDCLMKAVRITTSRHDTSGKLIDNKDLVIFYYIVLILVHQVVCTKCKSDVVLDLQILNVEELLYFMNTLFGQVDDLIFLINNEVTGFDNFLTHDGCHLCHLMAGFTTL